MAKSDELIKDDEWKIRIPEERERGIASVQKVPRELREKMQNERFFDPRVVSIGPYHHGKAELDEVERFKSITASAYVSNREALPYEFYNKVLEVISDARMCYLPGSTDAYDDKAFADMMFFDGCFILQFIDANISDEEEPFLDELINHVGSAAYRAIMTDMMLLENQLPFIVLEALMSTRYPEAEAGCGEKMIENFILQIFIDNVATPTEQTYRHEAEPPPLHFLELVRRRFLGRYFQSTDEKVPSTDEEVSRRRRPSFKTINISSCFPFFKLIRGGGHRENKQLPNDPMKDTYSYSFRSATELKARGIHFRPSNTFYLNDFTFTSQFGYGLLTLPQLAFGWGIKYWFLNMMAYELAPSVETNDWEVCNYVYFMSSLINGAEDVMELRTHNIIHNFYGTDEELAKEFNSMATGGAYLCYEGPIKDASDGIQKHYNSRMKTWTAQLRNNYFSTPWSSVAFFAATFALVLTALSTYFQIYPR